MSVLPWHQAEFERLIADKSRLPHALLFYGRLGIGKLAFARAFAQALLCESPDNAGGACGYCAACGWFDAASHPDFRLIEPESLAERMQDDQGGDKKASQQISVEQVRGLSDFIHISSHRGGPKVLLIHPAEALNASSANALLKNLEEPPPGTYFLLVAHRIHYLLPTIRSRCRQMALPGPDPKAAAAWLRAGGIPDPDLPLAQAGNSPLLARQLADQDYRQRRDFFLGQIAGRQFDALRVAEQIGDYPVQDVVSWLQKWSFDLAAQKFLGRVRYNPDYAEAAKAISARMEALEVLRYHRGMVKLQRIVTHPLNARLFLEQLLIEYADLADAGRRAHANRAA